MNSKKCVKLMILLIISIGLLNNDCFAQSSRNSPIWRLSGAKELQLRMIDTTNVSKIKSLMDTTELALSYPAIIYFAQHGDRSIISRVDSILYKNLLEGNLTDVYYMLAAHIALNDSLSLPLIQSVLDTMLVKANEARSYNYADKLIDMIEILVDFGDFSRYDLFKQLITSGNSSFPVQVYFAFSKDPTKETDAYNAIKEYLLNSSDKDFRLHALHFLYLFNNRISEKREILKHVALNDPSGEIRHGAMSRLESMGYIYDAIEGYESLIRSKIDTLYCKYSVFDLDGINSPFALAALKRLKNDIEPGAILDRILLVLDTYRAPKPLAYDSLTVKDYIDSLSSFVSQCGSLGWIGDQLYIKQLNQNISDSKASLITGDSIICAKNIKQFQQAVDREYRDTTNATPAFVTTEGWKFLYYNAQYILDRLPQIPPSGCNVKLVNSTGTKLTSGTLQYYEGSWKEAANNNDGTFFINTTKTSLSLRMTYEYGTQTKSNVSISSDTVVFQTVNAKVQLQNSSGVTMDTGSVQYYAGAWREFGTTESGVANKELLPNNYSFRMTYAYASNDKKQDLNTNPIVIFQTVNAAVQLQNSQGTLIDQGTVQYYAGAWRVFGTTTNGEANKELLPNNYSFRMTYAYASKDKQQDLNTNPMVVFQTVNAKVQLQNSNGVLIDTGTVKYYAGAWRDLGTTVNGMASKELLPNNYSFRMTYAYANKDKQQDLNTNPTVVFQTVNAAVQLQNSQGALIDQGTVQYYSGAWREFGTTTNGVANKELLPNNYSFRMTYENASIDKKQDLSTNSIVVFSTVLCTIRVKNAQNEQIDGAMASYYSGAWRQIGLTVNGEITKELLPLNLSFRVKMGTKQQDKKQDLSTNTVVEFTMQ